MWIEQELQYKYQELKTATEEIQSIMEKLQTIEAERHYSRAELERVNNDLTVGVASAGRDDRDRERQQATCIDII